MQIHGLSQITGSSAIDSIRPTQRTEQVEQTQGLHGADSIEFSSEAEMITHVDLLDGIRTDRIEQIRAQIAAGIYETDEKLDIAVGRLLDELVG